MDSPDEEAPVPNQKPRQLPSDLPTSLNDRRSVPVFNQETEIYDAWAGMIYSAHCNISFQNTYVEQDNHNSSQRLSPHDL